MELPPGPRIPALAQLGWWIARPLDLLERCQRRFGDVFTVRAVNGECFVIVADDKLIRDVLAADGETLRAGASNAAVLARMLGDYSLLTLDGREHLRQRRLLLPAFHGDRMSAYAATMAEITNAAIDRLPIGEPIAIHRVMQDITLEVILRTVFGVSAGRDYATLRARLVEFLDIAVSPWLLMGAAVGIDPFSIRLLKLGALRRAIDDALFATIAARRAAPHDERGDVLSMMLRARDDRGEPMTARELRDELVTLLIAGHETTATALAWAVDQLYGEPRALARLRDHPDSEYLDAVIRETLRVRPIVPLVGRQVAKPFTLGNWHLPVGTRLAPSIYLAARRADAYPEPARFHPERWLGIKPDPYTWLPFGGGIRRCIGMAFAQFEMRIVLATLVRRTELRLVGGPARVVRRGVTFAPAHGRRVVVDARTAA